MEWAVGDLLMLPEYEDFILEVFAIDDCYLLDKYKGGGDSLLPVSFQEMKKAVKVNLNKGE